MFGRRPDPEQERLRQQGRQFLSDKEAMTSRNIPGHQNYGRSFEDMLFAISQGREDSDPFTTLETLKSGTQDDPAGSSIVPEDEYERIRKMEMLRGMVNKALFERLARRGKMQPSQGGFSVPDAEARKWTR